MADVREMIRLGYTHQKIADHYGVDRPTMTMIINRPGFEAQKESVVSLVRNCENAWENIINFEKLDGWKPAGWGEELFPGGVMERTIHEPPKES